MTATAMRARVERIERGSTEGRYVLTIAPTAGRLTIRPGDDVEIAPAPEPASREDLDRLREKWRASPR